MPEPLKDLLFNQDFFADLVRDFHKHHPPFSEDAFLRDIYDEGWESRELKERIRHVTLVIHRQLDLPFSAALALFRKVISEEKQPSFGRMFFPDYVEVFGLDDPDTSLDALAFFTPYASSEFAVRPFILKYGQPVLDRMLQWAEHPNEHVRRLASEGSRPRLPWAMALPFLKKDPAPVLPILEKLKADPSEYVRRSVANHLNDISKDHPALVLQIAERWLGEQPTTDKLIKHALRTLLKAGDTRALILFGFEDPAHLKVTDLLVGPPRLTIGEKIEFSFNVFNPTPHPVLLRLEYGIDFVKKNGKANRKIFQITETHFPPGETPLKRKHSFADLSTRKHYPGEHQLTILVNGRSKASARITLETR